MMGDIARGSRQKAGRGATLCAIALIGGGCTVSSQATSSSGLTAVQGIKVGHHTLTERLTGCTVILTEKGAVAGVDVRGSAPGTRETALLNPTATVQQIHAIVLTGGSAWGLDSASGVMRYLEERGVGFRFGGSFVPIVTAAVLFDLPVGNGKIRPTADCGYAAAKAATTDAIAEGNVGAGAGATIGKMAGLKRAMKGGIGTAAITLPNGLVVAAIAAVNARGDVIDPADGRVVAGTRTEDGKGLADARTLLRSAGMAPAPEQLPNTTLGVVATNATLTKAEATRVAQMAQDGVARAIVPVHTSVDGDVVFALATGHRTGEANVDLIGGLAADAMTEAILRAVRAAKSIPGFPAASDMR